VDISKYKTVIFDCDGVIFQSNNIKTNAFRNALIGESDDLVDKFISYHQDNGGISRYVKFEHYYRNIKYEEQYLLMSEKAISRYAKIVLDQLMEVQYVPGFLEIINYLNNNKIPCFVVSGGDQSELHSIFKGRKIFDKFIEVLGSPITKNTHVGTMVKNNKLNYPTIFFGDSRSDMDAALNNGIDFCFISQFSEWLDSRHVLESTESYIINNFKDLV
jgi:phosphoglycolate phosphatase-like HAD superfamily hydrolase